MSVATRVFLAIAAGIALLAVTTVGVAATAIYRAGTIAVDVQPRDGGQVSVAVPAVVANLAVALVPAELIRDASDELRPVWPTVQAAGDELWSAPDFVLLEVTGPHEHVKIEKRSGRLIVLVNSDGDRILVEVPIRTLRRITDKLGGSWQSI